MSDPKLPAINSFVSNLYDQLNVGELKGGAAAAIRAWFIDNMSNIGRWSNRDFERFGRLEGRVSGSQGRQDGWVSMTEEVPDTDHITYGTGVLYIHGEMEMPKDGTAITNSCFRNADRRGNELIKTSAYSASGAYSNKEGPIEVDADAPNIGAPPTPPGFNWEFSTSGAGGQVDYAEIIKSVSGIETRMYKGNAKYDAHLENRPNAEFGTPAVFNDDKVYEIDNERHNFPLIIVNSAQPASIEQMLNDQFNQQNGMYDDEVPALVDGSWPPSRKMQVSAGQIKSILDYISPLETDNYDK